ncbi:MAG: GNAT family N-acetyltransferase [Candidatus Brachytrichaceae bacterium NZ_4S206]|jgi:GNAT superfamily N-acetyltransferase
MTDSCHFVPASSLTLDAFVDLYTRSFEGYFYPMQQTVEGFAARMRVEQHDLYRSVVLLVDGEPAGQATIAIRGERAWCGGFGIVPKYRGQKLGRLLFAEFVSQARRAGMKTLQLEALTRNTAALSVYTGAGMRPMRETRLLEWKREGGDGVGGVGLGEAEFDQPADMARIAECFGRLHPVAPIWSHDLPSLMLRGGLLQLQLQRDGQIAAYVLFTAHEGTARIVDVGAEDAARAAELLLRLQSHYNAIVMMDAPADSPITAAFDRTSFREFDRQYELLMRL